MQTTPDNAVFEALWYNRHVTEALTVQSDRVSQEGESDALDRPQRRRPVTAAQREQIIEANVVEGKTHREIAQALGRSEHTIRGVLRTPAAKARKEEILKEIASTAREVLRRNAKMAAEKWVQIVEQSPDVERIKDYKAAKDLLTHAGVIDIPKPEKDAAPQFLIQIGGGEVRDIEWDEAEVNEPPALPASSP